MEERVVGCGGGGEEEGVGWRGADEGFEGGVVGEEDEGVFGESRRSWDVSW